MAKALTKANLALGGGASAGFAHIGVLRALAENNVEIASIVGTSVGAMLGAIFAYNLRRRFAGLPPLLAQRRAAEALTVVALTEDFKSFEDAEMDAWRTGTVFMGDEMMRWLSFQLWDPSRRVPLRFAELGYDLQMTAVDSETGDCVVFGPGTGGVQIDEAARASASLPMVFQRHPVENGAKRALMWDGGLAGNCRFDLAYKCDPGIPTIASSLTYGGERYGFDRDLVDLLWDLRFKEALQELGKDVAHMVNIAQMHMERFMRESMPEGADLRMVRPEVAGTSVAEGFGLPVSERRRLIEAGWRAAIRDLGLRAAGFTWPAVLSDLDLLRQCRVGDPAALAQFRSRSLDNALRVAVWEGLPPRLSAEYEPLVIRCKKELWEEAEEIIKRGLSLRVAVYGHAVLFMNDFRMRNRA